MFGVVADLADILAAKQVPEPEPRFPGDGYDAANRSHPSEFSHRKFRVGEVLEDLDAGNGGCGAVSQRQKAGVSLDERSSGQSFPGEDELVPSIVDGHDEGAGWDDSARGDALPGADVDEHAGRPQCQAEAVEPPVEQPANEGLAGRVLAHILAGCINGCPRGEADRGPFHLSR
ncbi:MAG: hypothetical protein M3357_14165, partial [Actinomycetota bacterium]|nr:hypothetical protein [Actinomycetota bacterium]